MTRHHFAFTGPYRAAGLPFGVTPRRCWVDLDPTGLRIHFGPWRLTTTLANIDTVTRTGGFGFLKTAGPAHLSLADRGVTFASNGADAACLTFHRPVPAIDPWRRIQHPGATLTPDDVPGFVRELEELLGRA